jgi:hypothetical protein
MAPPAGTDLTSAFRAAYENRYTWDSGFAGYRGRCLWEQDGRVVEGRFTLGADLKATVEGIDDPEVRKAVASQLWEVAIHRVRRPFEQTHGENSFTACDSDSVGTVVIVGGKIAGDRYRIKDNVVTMVYRHIHGTVVTIYTKSVTEKTALAMEAAALLDKLDRAEKLIGGLGGERARWEQSIARFNKQLTCVPGDALVAAAFMSYAGPFDTQYRESMVTGWQARIRATARVSRHNATHSFC